MTVSSGYQPPPSEDFFRSAGGTLKPDGTNDLTDAIIHSGMVGVGRLATTDQPNTDFYVGGSLVHSAFLSVNQTVNGGSTTISDTQSGVIFPQTTPGISIFIQPPTNTLAGRMLRVFNTGTAALTVNSFVIDAGFYRDLAWNGTSWTVHQGGISILPQTLHWARWQLAFPSASTAFAVPPGTNMMPLFFAGLSSGFGLVTDATNIVCAQAGRYRFDWLLMAPSTEFNDDGEVHIVVNGVTVANVPYDMNQAAAVNQTTGTLTVDLSVNDLVQFRYAGSPTADTIVWGKGTYLHVQQIPSSTVILPGSIPGLVGATGIAAGVAGYIGNAPLAGQQNHVYRGDGTFDFQGKKSTVAISNIAANGSLGSAAATVDIADELILSQTTANITASLQNPTITTKYRTITIQNIGTVAIGVNASGFGTTTIPVNGVLVAEWNGLAAAAGRWVLLASTPRLPNVQTFLANGTYTPSVGMKYCIARAVGGGASAGGAAASVASTVVMVTGGGGCGAYVEVMLTAAQIGNSQIVTIGAGGPASAVGGGGNNGGATSLGALFSAGGGLASAAAVAAGNFPTYTRSGGNGGTFTITTGVNLGSKNGKAGDPGTAVAVNSGTYIQPGAGAKSELGMGTKPNGTFFNNLTGQSIASVAGAANTGDGSSGTGTGGAPTAAAIASASGGSGKMIITEYF